ncbi:MAG: AtpZ/AtpI family protein [Parasphingopyxis sp.]|nr:AtpZ/AtpI family protein [Sphingomonadales bacterium]
MAENEPERDPFLAEDSRLRSLDERLDAMKRTEARKSARRKDSSKSSSMAQRAVGELIGGPVGGAIVGWVLDRLFGTYPWFMMALLFLGFAVAVVNVYRLTSKRSDAGEADAERRE